MTQATDDTRAAGPGSRAAGAAIKPAQVQVVFADLQPALVGNSVTLAPEAMTRSAVGLAEIASLLDMPMWFSVAAQAGMDPTMVEALAPWSRDGNILHRVTPGALQDAPTREALAGAERPVLVVCGFAAEVVVLQSVLDALAAGYRVYHAVDAIGGLSARSEQAAFREMEAAGATPTSVVSLAARLAPDFSRAPGTDVLAVMMSVMNA
ncbi:isochorismatase family protein [Kushneria aurantia]|uniref:Isochorismatase family protein n=1 Tax=Kushneria aurantia TaxID=504092 RepID=A0ABV6G2K7_9GAMM|nr:isochorismatase family protein [Kushneria aurantia]